MPPAALISFPWQNPFLRDAIYPYRRQRLLEFLLIYTEMDAWNAIRDVPASFQSDPETIAEIRQHAAGLRLARQQLQAELGEALAAETRANPEFAAISGATEAVRKGRQIYYLNRKIARLEESIREQAGKRAELQARKDFADRQLKAAQPLDEPLRHARESASGQLERMILEHDQEIGRLEKRAGELRELRRLLTGLERLPNLDDQGKIVPRDQILWKLARTQAALERLSHDELLQAVLRLFDAELGRFSAWLQFMVIHFFGLRYPQLPGSWSDAKFLLEVFTRDLLKNEVGRLTEQQVEQAFQQAFAGLEAEQARLTAESQRYAIQWKLTALKSMPSMRAALLEYQQEQALDQIQRLPDQQAVLGEMFRLKQRYDPSDPLPEWVWHWLTQATWSGYEVPDIDRDAHDKESYRRQAQNWSLILDAWRGEDITGWRSRHSELFDLVVTQAVYQRAPEHIQLLRGLAPAMGLANKPDWYLRAARANPDQAYFKRPSSADDFRMGASLLFLDVVERPPDAMHVVHPLPDLDLAPIAPHPFKGRAAGSRAGANQIEGERYLSWASEAIVVEVAELVDGPTVLTLETGQDGLTRRPLDSLIGNPFVFIGYIPATSNQPGYLAAMLRRDRLLPAG